MNFTKTNDSVHTDTLAISRREAIRRAALILGVAISPSLLTGVMSAQPAPTTAGAKPVYLSAKQAATAGAVAERIIPRTDTPGALDVGVPAFVDLMFGKFMTADEKNIFAAGLADVEARSVTANKRAFSQLSAAQQDSLLTEIAEAAQNKTQTFFHLVKELTLLGYFTSEPVGKTVLHYDPVPGKFQADIPLSEVGNRSWTK